MSWATKRRFIYGGSLVGIFTLVFLGVFWRLLYNAPTCSDGIKNGDEKGVDCGGSCKNLCTSDALSPVILWSEVFNISGNVYSAVALIENLNINSKNERATYQFRLFDANNRLINIIEGETSIPKGKRFAVFETGIIMKNSKPKSADFRFLSFSKWEKDLEKDEGISLEHSTVLSATTTPKITGVIFNKSLQNIETIELVVLVQDSNENVIGASKTFIDNLIRNTSQDFVFTWPKPFEKEVDIINIIYRKL